MEVLRSTKNKNKLIDYMKRAIGYENTELEFAYGKNPLKDKLTKLDFLRILNELRQSYPCISEDNSLDIQNEYRTFKRSGLGNIRCSISGIENIKMYCKTNSIEDIPSAIFVRKERDYKDPKFPSVNFKPIIDYDYNFRINLKREEILNRNNREVQKILENWNGSLKYFRYKKRYSFITSDNLFRIDLTVIKSNRFNYEKKRFNLFQTFIESGILNNPESYELEIEYIGSTQLNKKFPIDTFIDKFYLQDEKEMKKFEDRINTMIKDSEQKSVQMKKKADLHSELLNFGNNIYSDLNIVPSSIQSTLPSVISEGAEFQEEDIFDTTKPETVLNPDKIGFADIKYEFWMDSEREWLFEAMLTYSKGLDYVKEIPNGSGDYEGSPQNSKYIEFQISPEFTEEEISEISEIENNFNHFIQVPYDLIVIMDPWIPNIGKQYKPPNPTEEKEVTVDEVASAQWTPWTGEKVSYEVGKYYSELFDTEDKEKEKEDKLEDGRKNLIIIRRVCELFKSHIIDILQLIETRNIIIPFSKKEEIIKKYETLTEQDTERVKFQGPQPVSMSLNELLIDNKHSIFTEYVVTEKADGIRAQLLIDHDPTNEYSDGYLITPKMEIIGTGLRFKNINGIWLFDGEYITQNKNGDPIELFMIFDVYYASDGASKYPSHAYTFPWSGVKKTDIGRSSIIQDFKNTVQIVQDTTEFRIGYKNYLDGPKRLQKSKKDPNKYSNINGIFSQSKKLLDIDSKKGGFEYSIDGLIYLPMYLSVGAMEKGETKRSFNGTWSINYKWKPPEENTIDFKIRVVKDKTKNGLRDKITSTMIKGKVVKCKQVRLYVGYDVKEDNSIDFNWELLTESKLKNFREILFDPNKDKSLYTCNIPLTNDKMLCLKDKSEIMDEQIIEMRYLPDNPKEMSWEPLRVRTDKINPQFFETSYKIWNTIVNPVTTEFITGEDDVSEVKKLLKFKAATGSLQEDSYYVAKENDVTSDLPLRKFHNYIKNKLITSICSVGNRPISIMDTSIGQGGDIGKYLYSRNKIMFLFGLDISPNVKDAAKRYYLEMMRNNNKPKASMFIQYDTSESIRDGFGYKGTDEDIERNRSLINIIYDKNKKVSEKYDKVNKIYNGIAKKGFDVISSQFSVHYYFKDEMTLRGYLQNISDNCNKGGYFIGTCYDGSKVFELLKQSPTLEMKDEFENKVYSITKNYDIDSFEYNKGNVSSMFGQEIVVEMSSIGQAITEYLVNFDMFKDFMKLYKFKLVKPNLRGKFSGIFDNKDYVIEEGLGSFETIINNLPKLSSKDPLLKDKNTEMKKKRGPYYEANKMNTKNNDLLKQLSSLNNWFIFQKY